MIPKGIKDEKWDVRKEQVVYSEVYTHRLILWIKTGRIKKGEVVVWRGGLSGWTRPELLPELIPFFEEYAREQKRKRKKRIIVHKKKDIKTILVIDDEEDTCNLLKQLLEKFEVYTTTTGRAGINFVKGHKPDLVLLDLRLDDMDGLKVLSKIKKISPGTIVTMISAYGDEDIKQEARHIGAFEFLDKPLFEKKVINIIKKAKG